MPVQPPTNATGADAFPSPFRRPCSLVGAGRRKVQKAPDSRHSAQKYRLKRVRRLALQLQLGLEGGDASCRLAAGQVLAESLQIERLVREPTQLDGLFRRHRR